MNDLDKQIEDNLRNKGWSEKRIAARRVENAIEKGKRDIRSIERKFIDPTGFDYTDYIINDEKEELFYLMCLEILKCKRPLKECYKNVAQVLNLNKLIKGEGPQVIIQCNPQNN